jgi:glutamyl-tRNA reductase
MTLTASHRDLDLDVLEQLSSGAHSVGTTIASGSPAITGCVVLATCNRFEVYVDTGSAPLAGPDAESPSHVRAVAVDAVASTSRLAAADVAASLQVRTGPAVAEHLYAVASGLDSMVVGEREVAGQVRRALQTARAQGTTSPALERLFQTASRTSRAVASQTGLGSAGRSAVGVALDIAAEELAAHGFELADVRVLLVGTGSYAGASVTALRARGVHDLAVHSPSGRARDFAGPRGLEAVDPSRLDEHVARAELVLCCSGALGPVIDAAMVADARARSAAADGRARPTVLVDLALRHDIDPAVRQVPGVRLVDLAAVQAHSPTTVTPAVEAGRRIVREQAVQFEESLAEQALVPAVVALREHVQQALEVEVDRARALARARGDDDATADAVERSLRRFAASVLHTPAVRAREHAREGRHVEYRDALEALFGIAVPPDGESRTRHEQNGEAAVRAADGRTADRSD